MTDRRRTWVACDAQRGSVLLLFPSALLIMMILGSVAADRMIIVQSQRELVTLAQTTASEAIDISLDVDHLRSTGSLRWDLGSMATTVEGDIRAFDPSIHVRWAFDGTRLTVWLQRRIRVIFGTAVTGRRTTLVTARATARLPRR